MAETGDFPAWTSDQWTAFHAHESISKLQKKGEKHPVCSSLVGENALLMLEVRGEWPD